MKKKAKSSSQRVKSKRLRPNLTPSTSLDHVSKVEMNSEEVDLIVQDHDNFGTHEELDEDSVDAESSSKGAVVGSSSQGVKRKCQEEVDGIDDDDAETVKKICCESEVCTLEAVEENAEKTPDEESEKRCDDEEEASIDEPQKPEEVIDLQQQPQPPQPQQQQQPSQEMLEWLERFGRWSQPDKLQAIDRLISACQPLQVRHMMSVIEPQFQRDFISLFPKELALYVLGFLSPRDLLRAAQTCKYWRILCEDNLLWREKCREQQLELDSVLSSRLSRRSHWKANFMRQHRVETNWRKVAKSPQVLKGHEDHVITCLQFNGDIIVSGSDDNTLRVWSAASGKCLRTLVGHGGGVWSSQMSGDVIVSGSTDRTLKVWNAKTGVCRHTLYGHTSTVRCMHLHGNRVVSGSRDATLRLWNVETGECQRVLVGHVAAVRCVQYDGRIVVSGMQ